MNSYTVSGSEWSYVQLKVTFDPISNIDTLLLRTLISKSLQDFSGLFGSSIHIDVLTWDEDMNEGVIRVPNPDLTILWSSLTMMQDYNGKLVRIDVKQVSNYLCSILRSTKRFDQFEPCPKF
ncbi:hypothetical protein BKA69DRAFT_1044674 [Paraphysoderma sedebokerense]|nr:hypothetical protein BKA69DRAFT_1044674 [Paraphysoderma sedebokerense]